MTLGFQLSFFETSYSLRFFLLCLENSTQESVHSLALFSDVFHFVKLGVVDQRLAFVVGEGFIRVAFDAEVAATENEESVFQKDDILVHITAFLQCANRARIVDRSGLGVVQDSKNCRPLLRQLMTVRIELIGR